MTDLISILPTWEARCRQSGLKLTAPRRAVLAALIERDAAIDAVALMQNARTHCHSTSLGTVYRFLRELEGVGLLHAQLQLHGRTRWLLCELGEPTQAAVEHDLAEIVHQLKTFLGHLQSLGLAARCDTVRLTYAEAEAPWMLMRNLAPRLGYRLLASTAE